MNAPTPTSEPSLDIAGRIGVPYIDYLPDNHIEAMAAYRIMARPCVGCPYTPETEAARDPLTSRLARECAEARCAFWCHMSGAEPTRLCAGWATEIERRAGGG